MKGSKRVAAIAAFVMLAFAPAALADTPIEETLSYRMLQAEAGVRPVPRAKFDLLRSVLTRATNAARTQYFQPRTRRDVVAAFDAIQIAFAEHNFIQPPLPEDDTDTIGDALEPLQLSPEARRRLFAPGEVNGFRARYIDPSKPLYFVSGAIASQLFISVGQRLGWDIRLMTAPGYYYVRWQYYKQEVIYWDWTNGGPSAPNAYPIGDDGLYQDWPARQRHGRTLSQGYARATYLHLTARHVGPSPEKRQLLESAMFADPTHELVQNSLAWLYATDPAVGRTRARQAVAYALSAWAASPGEPQVADTVACAFAATGERSVAVEIERSAIARLRASGNNRLIPAFEARLRQIQAGGRCRLTP